jgi:predicted Rossmann fold nucleotide-binding protein DprA/Smf involved in DNA uptake
MDSVELILLVSAVPGIGEKSLGAILHRNAVLRRTPDEFLRRPANELTAEYGVRRDAAELIASLGRERIQEASRLAREIRRAGIAVLTSQDAVYPKRLLAALDDPPPVLYTYGNLDLVDGRLFAVANSNGAGEDALAATDRAAEAAIEAGWHPVTGHNRQAYQRPALVARRTGGRVCYVLDRGLLEAFGNDLSRELFPAARIWSPAYDPACDLSLSPFPLRAHSLADHNSRRDSLIFALSDAVIVGEVRAGGRMERECIVALRRGKPVVLVGPERDGDKRLVAEGAKRLDDPDFGAAFGSPE